MKMLLVLLVGVAHLVELERRVAEEDRGGELAILGPRHVVGEHPAPPEVLRPNQILAFPEDQGDQRRAHLLAGLERQMGQLLAGLDPQRSSGVARERRRPLARPAHRDHHPAAGHRQIVVRERPVRAAARRPGRTSRRVPGRASSPAAGKDPRRTCPLSSDGGRTRPSAPRWKRHVDPLDLLEDRRGPACRCSGSRRSIPRRDNRDTRPRRSEFPGRSRGRSMSWYAASGWRRSAWFP